MRVIIDTEFAILQLLIIMSTIKNLKYTEDPNEFIKKIIALITITSLIFFIPKVFMNENLFYGIVSVIIFMIILFTSKKDLGKNIVLFSLGFLFVNGIELFFRNKYIISRMLNSTSLTSKSEIYYIFFQIIFVILLISTTYVSEKSNILINYIYTSNIRIGVLIFMDILIEVLLISEIHRKMYWLSVVKIIILLMVCIIMFIIVNYFAKISFESSQIGEINKALEEKNDELRRIKHDYGAQISYLYGLHLLKRFDELENALNEICANNRSTNSAVIIKNVDDSIIYEALQSALRDGIHVIIKENAHLNKLYASKEELFVVLSQIGYILSKQMNGEGIIYARSYETVGNIIIKIENSELNYKKKHTFEGEVVNKVLKLSKVKRSKSEESPLINIINNVNSIGGKVFIKNGEFGTKIRMAFPLENH